MALPQFFRTYRPRQFDYKPMYYDQQKDEMQERIRRIEQEMGIQREGEYHIGITRGAIRRARGEKKKLTKSSNVRLLIILLILLALAYLIFYR